MKTAFFDLSSGVAGDMIISSLLSAGLDFERLQEGLSSLGVTEYEILRSVKKRSALAGEYIEVKLKPHSHPHKHDHSSGHKGHHHGVHGTHSHDGNAHDSHRHLKTIVDIIVGSELPEVVKSNAIKVFELLGEAEAKVHGVAIEKIHFHEVGAVDSIVDIVGGCLGLHLMGIEKVTFNHFHFGKGSVHCAHGDMPIPVPATIKISTGYDCVYTDVLGELTTPTGAAMMAALGEQVSRAPNMKTDTIGYGAGTNEYSGVMGLLRVIIGESGSSVSNVKKVVLVETNIDDMSSEILSHTCAKLLEISKQDVWVESIVMKKNRVGQKICILCDEEKIPLLEKVLFQETTTFGFRYQEYKKIAWSRHTSLVTLHGLEVRLKSKILDGEELFYPEFEDCKKVSEATGLPLQEIFQQAKNMV